MKPNHQKSRPLPLCPTQILTPELRVSLANGADATEDELQMAGNGRRLKANMFLARLLVIKGATTVHAADYTGVSLSNLNVWCRANALSPRVASRPVRIHRKGGRSLSQKMLDATEMVRSGTPACRAAEQCGVTRKWLKSWARNNGLSDHIPQINGRNG